MPNGDLTREDIEAIAVLKDAVPRMEDKIGKIFELLDGPAGIVTGVALNHQSIKRIWWWLGGVSFTIMGIAAYVVKTQAFAG